MWEVWECGPCGGVTSLTKEWLGRPCCPICLSPVTTSFQVARVDAKDGPAPATFDANMLGGFTGATSRRAALDHYPRSGTLRGKVLAALIAAGARGATSDELADRHGWRLYSVKPRLIELRRGGWAEPSGSQRPSATGSMVDVYVATAKGREELRASA